MASSNTAIAKRDNRAAALASFLEGRKAELAAILKAYAAGEPMAKLRERALRLATVPTE